MKLFKQASKGPSVEQTYLNERLRSAKWLGWDGDIPAATRQRGTETVRKNSPIDDFPARSKPA